MAEKTTRELLQEVLDSFNRMDSTAAEMQVQEAENRRWTLWGSPMPSDEDMDTLITAVTDPERYDDTPEGLAKDILANTLVEDFFHAIGLVPEDRTVSEDLVFKYYTPHWFKMMEDYGAVSPEAVDVITNLMQGKPSQLKEEDYSEKRTPDEDHTEFIETLRRIFDFGGPTEVAQGPLDKAVGFLTGIPLKPEEEAFNVGNALTDYLSGSLGVDKDLGRKSIVNFIDEGIDSGLTALAEILQAFDANDDRESLNDVVMEELRTNPTLPGFIKPRPKLGTVGISHPPLERGDRGRDVMNLQEALEEAGFAVGKVDGIFGRLTQQAMSDYQRALGLDVTGKLDIASIRSLASLNIKSRETQRQEAMEAVLGTQGDTPLGERSQERKDLQFLLGETYENPTLVRLGAQRARVENNISRTLRRGAQGDDVRTLQAVLAEKGFDPGPADGIYGPLTEAAVRAFQDYRGLTVDGVAGKQTLGSLVIYGGRR